MCDLIKAQKIPNSFCRVSNIDKFINKLIKSLSKTYIWNILKILNLKTVKLDYNNSLIKLFLILINFLEVSTAF